jgi:hypothetical protein
MIFAMTCQLLGSLHQDKKDDLIQWFTALYAKAITVQPEWRSSCFIVDDAIYERNAIKYVIFQFVFFFAFICFCFIYLAFTNKFMFCVHLCGGIKMFLYIFVRNTFSKIKKKRQFQKSKTFLYGIPYSTNVECRCTHNWDIKKANNYFSIGSSLLQKMHEIVVVTYFKILPLIFLRIIFQL